MCVGLVVLCLAFHVCSLICSFFLVGWLSYSVIPNVHDPQKLSIAQLSTLFKRSTASMVFILHKLNWATKYFVLSCYYSLYPLQILFAPPCFITAQISTPSSVAHPIKVKTLFWSSYLLVNLKWVFVFLGLNRVHKLIKLSQLSPHR